jgi:glutathione S-transferase
MPEGLLESARADLRLAYDALDSELTDREFVSGPFSIADIALFRTWRARGMEVEFSAQSHLNLARRFRQMRTLLICAPDSQRARDYVAHMKDRDLEKKRIFWRGDRIEWILLRGFHPWFFKEINEGPVARTRIPAPLSRNAV